MDSAKDTLSFLNRIQTKGSRNLAVFRDLERRPLDSDWFC